MCLSLRKFQRQTKVRTVCSWRTQRVQEMCLSILEATVTVSRDKQSPRAAWVGTSSGKDVGLYFKRMQSHRLQDTNLPGNNRVECKLSYIEMNEFILREVTKPSTTRLMLSLRRGWFCDVWLTVMISVQVSFARIAVLPLNNHCRLCINSHIVIPRTAVMETNLLMWLCRRK